MVMKKLLVILLLFFPVHGAWGKNITNLFCLIQFGNQTSPIELIIDFDNNTVRATTSSNYARVVITDHIIAFKATEKTKQPGTKDMTYTISRKTGKIEVVFIQTNGHISTFLGKCEETPGKNKF